MIKKRIYTYEEWKRDNDWEGYNQFHDVLCGECGEPFEIMIHSSEPLLMIFCSDCKSSSILYLQRSKVN